MVMELSEAESDRSEVLQNISIGDVSHVAHPPKLAKVGAHLFQPTTELRQSFHHMQLGKPRSAGFPSFQLDENRL
jgi:hypothetical protein